MFAHFFSDPTAWLLSLLLGYLVYYLAKFYQRVKSLPPGPLPLPLVGNVLLFRGTKKHVLETMLDVRQKYGPVFTFWAGKDPYVFIADLDLANETFKKNEFAGRPRNTFTELFSNDKHTDIVFADFGPTWESLRRVAHAAVRKYSVSDSLAYLVRGIVEETVATLKDKAEVDGKVKPFDCIYFMISNILITSTFGVRFSSPDSPDFKRLKHYMSEFFNEVGNKILLIEFLPFLKPFFKQTIKQMKDGVNNEMSWLLGKFQEKKQNYQPEIVNNFCDALISAREEAIAKGKENAPFLTDENLALSVFDLFLAGTDTSQNTFKWILLFVAVNPELQAKMRQEIESQIGDRMPVQEDKNKCHYVNAFITETMRFRSIAPVGVFRKTVVNTRIGKFDVPKNTIVFVFQQDILWDPKHWPNWDPKEFVPERFLINGEFVTQKPAAFIPFGVGRRACLGEKLALADLFLVTVNFLQATSGYEIALATGPESVDLSPEPNNSSPDAFIPKDYEIIFQKTN